MNVKTGLKRSGRDDKPERFKKPVIVALSSAAVIVLSVIVVSQFSPMTEQQFGADAPDDGEVAHFDSDEEETTTDQEQDFDAAEEQPQEEDYTEQEQEIYEEEPPTEEDSVDPDQSLEEEQAPLSEQRSEEISQFDYYTAVAEPSSRLYTLPFLASDEETVVNITVQASGDDESQLGQLLASIQPEEYGLRESPLKDFIEEGSTGEKLWEGLSEISRFDNFDTTEWPSQIEEVLSEVSDAENANGYFLLPADNRYAYLVTGRSLDLARDEDRSLEDTLKFMETEEEEDRFFSIIPEEVDLESVDVEGDSRVILSYEGIEDVELESELLVFVEGVLLTAADYGYREIEFDGVEDEDFTRVGPYELTRTLNPPFAPNYLGELEVEAQQ